MTDYQPALPFRTPKSADGSSSIDQVTKDEKFQRATRGGLLQRGQLLRPRLSLVQGRSRLFLQPRRGRSNGLHRNLLRNRWHREMGFPQKTIQLLRQDTLQKVRGGEFNQIRSEGRNPAQNPFKLVFISSHQKWKQFYSSRKIWVCPFPDLFDSF